MLNTAPRPFRLGPIEPIVEVGQNVLLVSNQRYRLYQVAYIEPVKPSHPLVVDISAGAGLGAGAALPPWNSTAVLDMQDGQLAQIRAKVLDDFHCVVAQPQALARGAFQNVNDTLNAFAALEDPCGHLSEYYIYQRDRVFLTATNPTAYALAQVRVKFWGFRYVLAGTKGVDLQSGSLPALRIFETIKDAMESGEKFTIIPTGGWAA